MHKTDQLTLKTDLGNKTITAALAIRSKIKLATMIVVFQVKRRRETAERGQEEVDLGISI